MRLSGIFGSRQSKPSREKEQPKYFVRPDEVNGLAALGIAIQPLEGERRSGAERTLRYATRAMRNRTVGLSVLDGTGFDHQLENRMNEENGAVGPRTIGCIRGRIEVERGSNDPEKDPYVAGAKIAEEAYLNGFNARSRRR